MDIYDIVFLVVLGYCAIALLIYKIQEKFIFKPEKLPQNFQYRYKEPFKELFFDMEDGGRINGLLFPVENSKGLIVYFHGNSRSIKGWAKYATDFIKHGFDVVMIDYRGFGKSIGRRSERTLKSDAQIIYQHLCKEYTEDKIIIYGRSMGSGFAAKVASVNHPRMLILDAPYYSFSRLTNRYLPFLPVPWILRYHIRTNTFIKYVRCPIRIIHGTKDRLIPIQSSKDLAKIMPEQTVLYEINGGGHNNLPSFPEYYEILGRILEDAFKLPYEREMHRPELF
jgi:pimeloyl-ACP methyl ester carboxylesterase